MFVISGLPESVNALFSVASMLETDDSRCRNNEKALFLLYNQLESEKERRVQSVAEDGAEEA